jgi:carbamoylphosphate synthase small subunit
MLTKKIRAKGALEGRKLKSIWMLLPPDFSKMVDPNATHLGRSSCEYQGTSSCMARATSTRFLAVDMGMKFNIIRQLASVMWNLLWFHGTIPSLHELQNYDGLFLSPTVPEIRPCALQTYR